MNARTASGWLLAGLAAVSLLLAGCSAGSSPSLAPPTSAPVATPSAAVATPKPTSEASSRTLVSGLMDCTDTEPDPAESPYPTAELVPRDADCTLEEGCGVEREWIDFTCTYAMSDPRVSGTERYLYRGTLVWVPELPGAFMSWDRVPLVLATPGGTWRGIGMGVDSFHEPTLYTLGYTVYEGQGAYAGLTYTLLWARERHYPGEPYLASGWIEPMK